jgi:hypothetical protein
MAVVVAKCGKRWRTRALVICPAPVGHGIVTLFPMAGPATRVEVDPAMTHFPQAIPNQRAPRVQLNGSVAAAIRSEGQQARGKLEALSITGGLVQTPLEFSDGDFVEIAFHTRSGSVHGMAEMLQPVRKVKSACLQPFRFIALGDEDHRKLRMALETALDRIVVDPFSDQLKPSAGL